MSDPSDTPRTDAKFGGMTATDAGYWSILSHARRLERELNEATKRVGILQMAVSFILAKWQARSKEETTNLDTLGFILSGAGVEYPPTNPEVVGLGAKVYPNIKVTNRVIPIPTTENLQFKQTIYTYTLQHRIFEGRREYQWRGEDSKPMSEVFLNLTDAIYDKNPHILPAVLREQVDSLLAEAPPATEGWQNIAPIIP